MECRKSWDFLLGGNMDYIGKIVKKFESGNKGVYCCVQSGFDDGITCGSYQFVNAYGIVINFLKEVAPDLAKDLYWKGPTQMVNYWPGEWYSSSPDQIKKVWMKAIERFGEDKFFELEHEKIKKDYYIPCGERIKNCIGININDISRAYQELTWSGAVHFGEQTFANMFIKAVKEVGNFASNQDKVFDRIYELRYIKMKEAYPNPGNRYLPGFFDGSSEVETLRPYLAEKPLESEEKEMNLIQYYCTKSDCYNLQKDAWMPKVKKLFLHSIGCTQPIAKAIADYWNQPGIDAMAHAIIEPSGNIYQLLPWNHRGWHSGNYESNGYSIGVEMTEPDENVIQYSPVGSANVIILDYQKALEHVETTRKHAVELFAMLCQQFELDPTTDIVSHAEGAASGIASNHADPEHLWKHFGFTMDQFREDVKSAIKKEKATMTAFWLCDGTLEITYAGADGVNLRFGLSMTANNVVGVLHKGEKRRVVQGIQMSDGQNWYRLESGEYITANKNYVAYTENNQKKKVGKVTGIAANDVLNVRDFPNSYSGNVTRTLKEGNLVRIIGECYNNGMQWYLVDQGNASNKFKGFVAAKYVK